MVDYAQLLNLDTSKLTSAAETSGGLSRAITNRGGEVADASQISGEMWLADDSRAAQTKMEPLPDPLYDVSDNAGKSKAILEQLAETLEKAKVKLADARDLVAGTGITISGDGTITTPVVNDLPTHESNQRIAQQARETIDEALKLANDADEEASGGLASAAGTLWGQFGPQTSGPLGGAAWAPWGISRANNVATWYKNKIPGKMLQFDRHAPISRLDKLPKDKYLNSVNKRKYLTRTGKLLDTESKLTKFGKVAGPVTSGIAGGAAGYEQWEKDSDLGTAERATRATVKGAAVGGGTLVGGMKGAAWGAAAGSAILPVGGTVAGAIVGGALGAWGGGKLGGWISGLGLGD